MSAPDRMLFATREALDPGAIRGRMLEAWAALELGDVDPGTVGGQLLRPRFAVAAAPADLSTLAGAPFWLAVLAVQLAHEASLLHDDVVDGATTRRGRATTVADRGIGAALIAGDQLLARAYLAASRTGSPGYMDRFAVAVERTIAGERAQGSEAGRTISASRAREIARGKSGELFGCALAAGATLAGDDRAHDLAELGRDIGLLYQRVDDLLDFCPGAGTGKPPFADDACGYWTWPRAYLEAGAGPTALFEGEGPGIPARLAMAELDAEAQSLRLRVRRLLTRPAEVEREVLRWVQIVADAVEGEIVGQGADASNAVACGISVRIDPSDPATILARHGRSFHFATRLMPRAVRDPVTRVYAVCRTLDDAVDRAGDRDEADRASTLLLHEARRGYDAIGDPVDPFHRAMIEMRAANVPFDLVERLVEGVRMDLEPRRYADLEDLRTYTHRVAGVVGLWIAGLGGCRDDWALHLANELGHAMQLTNIARDVGADLALGRLYLPEDLMARHRLTEEELRTVAAGVGAIPPGFAAALEELMGWADAAYGSAFQAIPMLPREYGPAVAVAARVYQGIHAEIRSIGYDTLRTRAKTGPLRKARLAFGALLELRAATRRMVALTPSGRP